MLAAVLIYFAVQLYNYLSDPVTTTLVTEGQAEDTIPLNGWMVRDEEPLAAQSGTISRVRQEGEHVGVGQILARVYANDGALQTVSQIETLQLQLQQLQFVYQTVTVANLQQQLLLLLFLLLSLQLKPFLLQYVV